ncbi:Oligopeptide transport ATP-binding protein OppD, partial [Haemophilus influenzae]
KRPHFRAFKIGRYS